MLGPTWQRTPDGEHWLLPERTLGWDQLAFCGMWLQHEGQPWRFTDEQARWLLWWSALDDDGRFLYRDFVLQRLKGWGKDPLGACLCFIELVGPARFLDWDGDRPIAGDVADAWVQTAAVALEQTKNTMRLFPALISAAAKARFRLEVLKEFVYAYNGERMIQAVTSAPTTLEGARATFVLKNEPHHWKSSNSGHEMQAVIARNAAKSADGAARTGSITNAYEPGQDSVAERDREAYEAVVAGAAIDTGLLYDSLEAPPEAPLTADEAPHVVRSIRGDSIWLHPERIVAEILDVRNPPSQMRRFWYNQITAAEDAWVTPQEWDACADVGLVVEEGELITLGFDGSKTDDSTALWACDVVTGDTFVIDIWEKPLLPLPNGEQWEIPMAEVDAAVQRARDEFDVVGFFGDLHPFESYHDKWARDFGATLCVRASPTHVTAFDMRSREREFTIGIEALHADIVETHKERELAVLENREPASRMFTHDGDPRGRRHAVNARRRPNRYGVSVGKESKDSPRKIDSVPAIVLARMARQAYLALPKSKQRRRRTAAKASFL